MPRLRVVIVGAGLMGRWHAYYATRAGAEIAAIVDLDEAAARSLASRFRGAASFPDLGHCLRSCAHDIVHICTGLESHVPLAQAALETGRHVLIEKPAADRTADVARLADLAARRHLKLGAVHQLPYTRGFLRLVSGVDRLGSLVRIAYETCSAGGHGLSARQRKNMLLEILPHPVSLLRALLGGPTLTVDWTVVTFTDDDLMLTGLLGDTVLETAISQRGRPTRNELVVTGTRASARVDLFHGYAVFEGGRVSRVTKLLAPFQQGATRLAAASANLVIRAVLREPAYPGLMELIRRYYTAVQNDLPPPAGAEEMMQAARVMEWLRGERSGPSAVPLSAS